MVRYDDSIEKSQHLVKRAENSCFRTEAFEMREADS